MKMFNFRFIICLSALLVGFSQANAFETYGVGLNTQWQVRRDYGENPFYRYTPELFVHTYFDLNSPLFLRPGVRLSYAWEQPEMPQSLRIEETDFVATAEVGLVYEWYVVPSLTLGMGVDFRTTKLRIEAPIDVDSDKISGSERLMLGYAQIGVGIPIEQGLFLIEPMVRFQRLELDDRSWLSFGVETSVGF